MNIISIVGARPQFIKHAPVSRALKKAGFSGSTVHTGQHYDPMMSDIFFRELDLDNPRHHLGIGSGPHGQQTGRMMEAIESVLLKERPDCVLVYGDTNSTLAGTLAAVKLSIPVAHVEAGARSFNRRMPEEINRVATDRLSTLLFAASNAALDNLKREGLIGQFVGDVMFDAVRLFSDMAKKKSDVISRLSLKRKGYALATVHRAENTRDKIASAPCLLGWLDCPATYQLCCRCIHAPAVSSMNLRARHSSRPVVGYWSPLAISI